ncbi:lipoprotein insertase outer membrane protein LolB [Lysobacter solisilvae (ex Woo and Kim 2020)]|uniref:Outer-membrane lipoprotein LolB n=1 Tax=Agrilutibacter terrestris TaxID=2865112 RepID=A0A7H0FV29_9GAMM|nr:lipoprotein insertase outer membrane protein LolB [Lysobacter terrestris]QNP39895.1 outer membrane lipoprotein LolB [Lysobacter terrestris]
MKVLRSFLACGLAALALTACVTQPAPRATAPVDAAQAQANDQRRSALRDWDLSGRIAVSNGSRGGSGRIDWQQRAADYTIALSAPVTRQSWQLRGNDQGARLDGIAGGPREDADVEALLLSATGWTIPVRALQDWVRGTGAADNEFGPARQVYGNGGLPLKLEQAGWAIEYQEWYPAEAGAPQLPRRIVARKGTASVRLVVDDWDVGAH